MSKVKEILTRAPILPVLVIERVEDAVPLAKALVAGGLPVLEVTLRTDAALESIAQIKGEVEGVICGAGTVNHAGFTDALKDVKADFAVSPGYTKSLSDALRAADIPLVPGVATASELMVCLDDGYSCCKFFPAEAMGGVKTLKSLSGPFPQARFCPTGGITPENLSDYLSLNSVLTAGGSWVAPKEAVARGDWKFIESLASKAVGIAT